VSVFSIGLIKLKILKIKMVLEIDQFRVKVITSSQCLFGR
jgi:hypothetical protein